MTAYNPGLEAKLNDILDILGTTKTLLVPGWESIGSIMGTIGAAGVTSSDEGGAVAVEAEFSPQEMPCGLHHYGFTKAGNLHLSGADNAAFTFDGGADAAFSGGLWIRPNVAILKQDLIAKYVGAAEEYVCGLDAAGKLYLELHDATDSTKEVATAATVQTAGQFIFVVFTYDGRNLLVAGWSPGTGFSDDWTIGHDHDGSARTWVATGSFQAALGDTDWNPASVVTVMHDDGLDGDLAAGDHVDTYRFTVPQTLTDVEWKVVNQQADFTDSTKLCPEGWNIDGLAADRPGWFFSAKTGQTVTLEFDARGGRMRARVKGPLAPVLLNEVAVSPSAGTFVEIINPNAFAVDLTGYYLSDRADYYLVVSQDNSTASDFIARFPNDTVIPADGMLIVAFDGAEFFNTFGIAADFEILSTDAGVTDMEENWAGAVGGTAGLTDATETLVLFFWDGSGELVIDSDYVFWGTPTPTNPAVDKTGVTMGSSTYQDDTEAASQAGPAVPVNGESVGRVDVSEGTEVRGQGNGFWGHDETSENLDVTWVLSGAPGPGCPAGQGLCSAACIDVWADGTNCGAGANVCLATENCCTGACSNPQSDADHCGNCATACGARGGRSPGSRTTSMCPCRSGS